MTSFGAYVGTTPATLWDYEKWLGRPVDQVLVSINQDSWRAFADSIPYDVSNFGGINRSLIWSVPLTVQGTSLASTATGAFNGYYAKAAQAALSTAQAGSNPIYIRLGWEFNLEMPWDARGNEKAFTATYQQAVDTFRSVSDRFKIVWDVNLGGSYDPALAYPGDKYVDVVGADTYFQHDYITDAQSAFDWRVKGQYGLQWQQDFAAAHNKPTAISEWGTDVDTGNPIVSGMKKWMDDHHVIYQNYWESDNYFHDELHNGAHPNVAAAFQKLFGAVPPAPSGTTVNTIQYAATSPVAIDLPGGTVSQAGNIVARFTNGVAAVTGAAPTSVYGLRTGSDAVTGGSGTLAFYGQGGSDMVTGGTGNVTLFGAAGAESLVSGNGRNIMYGGSGTNSMVGGSTVSSVDTFYGSGGTDTVTAKAGSLTLYAGTGKTTLNGGTGTSTIFTGSGTNTITGGSGKTVIYGGTGAKAGVNIEYAGTGTTQLYEGSGTDYFASNAGTCTIYGGSGKSLIYGGTGSQTIFTGAGNQTVSCGGGTTAFFETAANMTAGRWDQIDGFWGAKATELYVPSAAADRTWFSPVNGGTSITTAVAGGVSQLFVSGVDTRTVAAHTHFV